MEKKVLVLEDEINIRSFVVVNLRRIGYLPIEAETAEEAFSQMKRHPDIKIVLLDIMLPGEIDGLEVCRQLRTSTANIGIIMLTARSQEMDKVTGLMNGADDYITKPFSPMELNARVDALYRRVIGNEPDTPNVIELPPFVMDVKKFQLTKNGVHIKLTQMEFGIMRLLMENPLKVMSRDEIRQVVWPENTEVELKVVDVNIRRLRMKIEDTPESPIYITTVWGVGYKWGY